MTRVHRAPTGRIRLVRLLGLTATCRMDHWAMVVKLLNLLKVVNNSDGERRQSSRLPPPAFRLPSCDNNHLPALGTHQLSGADA
jgi:hypothetical protein